MMYPAYDMSAALITRRQWEVMKRLSAYRIKSTYSCSTNDQRAIAFETSDASRGHN